MTKNLAYAKMGARKVIKMSKRDYESFDPSGPEATPEGERRTNQKRGRKVLLAVVGVIAAAGVAIGGFFAGRSDKTANKKSDVPEEPTIKATEVVESTNPYAGELMNGVHYDYSHYADRHIEYDAEDNIVYVTNKETWNAYDYDMSDRYGDREATTDGILEVAERSPEALASYAYNLFTDEEKTELGINGMLITEIDDYMSSEDNADGGVIQGKLLGKLEQVLKSERTRFRFYEENDEEETNYIFFVDDNDDGIMTPDELHLGYDTKKRDGAKQVDIIRSFYVSSDKDGDHYINLTMLDLNMKCGFQPNYSTESLPQGLPHVDSDTDPVPPTPPADETPDEKPTEEKDPGTPTPPAPQTGKQGDPHGGDKVTPSAPVNPASEVSKDQNDSTNAGNQGYVDDHGAKPGDASTPSNNGSETGGFADSGIVAPDATTEGGRLQGGENQGTPDIAGENPYVDETANQQGENFDQFGNDQQYYAQNGGSNDSTSSTATGSSEGAGITPGGDNYDDQGEEDLFASGDF